MLKYIQLNCSLHYNIYTGFYGNLICLLKRTSYDRYSRLECWVPALIFMQTDIINGKCIINLIKNEDANQAASTLILAICLDDCLV